MTMIRRPCTVRKPADGAPVMLGKIRVAPGLVHLNRHRHIRSTLIANPIDQAPGILESHPEDGILSRQCMSAEQRGIIPLWKREKIVLGRNRSR